ncbi:MAG: thioredoxin family protein [Polyangiaceae bacterium]|nr:thioredoxin family protein [Polyangiaceae bacterium]
MRSRRHLLAVLALLAMLSWPALALAGTDAFTEALAENGPFFATLIAFGGGLLVCLTPCVYPMIAITVSVFGARQASSRGKGMLLSSAFVLGIVAMFAPLGLVAGLSGGMMGELLQNRWVLVVVGIVFIAMAASMFGAFEMVLPESLMQRLSGVGGIGYGGAFLLGLVSGIVAAPCPGPVLTGILLAINQTKNAGLGTLWMTAFSLGLGLPFWLVGTFAIALPKSGRWMNSVKSVFGVVMAVAACYFLQLAFPQTARTFAQEAAALFATRPSGSFLAVMIGLMLMGAVIGGIHLEFGDERARVKLRKGLGVLLMVSGGSAAIAGLRFEPEADVVPVAEAATNGAAEPGAGGDSTAAGSASTASGSVPAATLLTFLHSEADAWEQAKREKRPLLIDFFAEWCGACKDLSKKTFANDEVRRVAARFVAVKLDLTVNEKLSDEAQEKQEAEFEALKKKYRVVGLPTVILFDSEGNEKDRFFEFVAPEAFLARIEGIR